MDVKNLIAAVAVLAAAGSAFAQQTEFVRPDASFTSTLTRAEVRREVGDAFARNDLVPLQHDGQDVRYARGTRSRAEVRAEAASFRQSREAASGLGYNQG